MVSLEDLEEITREREGEEEEGEEGERMATKIKRNRKKKKMEANHKIVLKTHLMLYVQLISLYNGYTLGKVWVYLHVYMSMPKLY